MTGSLTTDGCRTAERLVAITGHVSVAEYVEALIDEAESLAAIREGIADLDAGRVRPLRTLFEEVASTHGFALEE